MNLTELRNRLKDTSSVTLKAPVGSAESFAKTLYNNGFLVEEVMIDGSPGFVVSLNPEFKAPPPKVSLVTSPLEYDKGLFSIADASLLKQQGYIFETQKDGLDCAFLLKESSCFEIIPVKKNGWPLFVFKHKSAVDGSILEDRMFYNLFQILSYIEEA